MKRITWPGYIFNWAGEAEVNIHFYTLISFEVSKILIFAQAAISLDLSPVCLPTACLSELLVGLGGCIFKTFFQNDF